MLKLQCIGHLPFQTKKTYKACSTPPLKGNNCLDIVSQLNSHSHSMSQKYSIIIPLLTPKYCHRWTRLIVLFIITETLQVELPLYILCRQKLQKRLLEFINKEIYLYKKKYTVDIQILKTLNVVSLAY